MEFSLLKIQHPFHPKHQLTITSSPYKDHVNTCGACCWGFDGSVLAYICVDDKCSFKLHLDCSKLLPSFIFQGHRHLLTLFEKTNYFTCHVCGVNCGNFMLRCVPCNFNIHLHCHPSAPETIKLKSHFHSLTLTSSPFEFELNSDEEAYNSEDEFYCDVCEEKRYKSDSVYYCAECKFIAEVKCVIPEVLPLIPKGDTTQQASSHEEMTQKSKKEEELSREIEKVNREFEELVKKKGKLEADLDGVTNEITTTADRIETLVTDLFMSKNMYLIEPLYRIYNKLSQVSRRDKLSLDPEVFSNFIRQFNQRQKESELLFSLSSKVSQRNRPSLKPELLPSSSRIALSRVSRHDKPLLEPKLLLPSSSQVSWRDKRSLESELLPLVLRKVNQRHKSSLDHELSPLLPKTVLNQVRGHDTPSSDPEFLPPLAKSAMSIDPFDLALCRPGIKASAARSEADRAD